VESLFQVCWAIKGEEQGETLTLTALETVTRVMSMGANEAEKIKRVGKEDTYADYL
jgi:hypothetical protein